jgi:hypothetical protein
MNLLMIKIKSRYNAKIIIKYKWQMKITAAKIKRMDNETTLLSIKA